MAGNNALDTKKESIVLIRHDGFELDWQETEEPLGDRQFSVQIRLFEEWR